MAKQLFDTMKNGYNRYQVEDYLNELEEKTAMLNRKVEMYRKRSEEVEHQLILIKRKYQYVVDNLAAKLTIWRGWLCGSQIGSWKRRRRMRM